MPSKAFSISQLGDTDTKTLFVDSANNYVGIGTNTPAVALDVIGTTNTKSVLLSGTVTPSIISANTNDWAPGTTNVFEVRLSANSSTNIEYNITGMAAGSNGQIVIIVNSGTSSIVLRNQDSGSSAANRFALPNDVRLFGSQTLPVYYDGVSQKWRAINSIGVPYFHKVDLTKGFFSGGSTGSYVTTADRTTYATETTAAVSGANLSQARAALAAAGNADKRFFSGGSTGSYVTTADRTTYATETTAAVSGANLSQARYYLAAAGNADKGFFSGGYNGSYLATADRTTYATETTAAVSGANLSSSRYEIGAAGNADKGFFSGGSTGSVVATADRTTYATETTAAVSGANLSQARATLAAAGNADKGFFSGGTTGSYVATADRTTYATETTAAVSGANLSQARSALAAA